MGTRIGDELVEVEAFLEAETPRAYLIQPTSIGPDECWVPKSHCRGKYTTSDRGVYIFHITEWIAGKKGLV